jgi:SagB-type dehydrogenase family enzyme
MRARLKSILQEFQQPLEQQEPSQAALFHEHSKLAPHRRTELGERMVQLQAGGLVKMMVDSYKSYPALPQTELPRAHLELKAPLQEVIVGRRSKRNFDTSQAVTLPELATVLQLAYGITGQMDLGAGVTQYQRAVPSAGGLYPLELYLMVQRVEGLSPGLYHYRVAHHALEQLHAGDQTERFRRTEAEWGMSAGAAFNLVISAVFGRSTVKYRDRGYRFVLMEAGGLATQAGLVGECLGLHSCAMGGFVDDELNRLFGLDGITEAVLLPVCFGK